MSPTRLKSKTIQSKQKGKKSKRIQAKGADKSFSETGTQLTRQNLEALIEASPLAIIAVNLQGLVTIWNPAAEFIFGWKKEEALGHFNPVVPEDKIEEFRSYLIEVQQGVTVRGLEIRRQRKDGRLLDISVSTAALKNDQGEVIGTMGILEDITKHKQAETELQSANEILRAVFQAAPVSIKVVDRDGKVLVWNPAAERIFGWSASEIIGNRLSIVPKGKEKEFPGMLQSSLQGKTIQKLETRRQRKDGTEIDVSLSAAPLRDSSGNIIGGVAIMADITERKRAEKELQQSNQSLQALIEASPLAIIAVDKEGIVKSWNPAAQKIFGWSAREALGHFIPVVPPDRKAEFHTILNKVLKGEQIHGLTVKRWRKNGKLIDVSLSTAPLQDIEGRIVGTMGIVEDITERKEAEAELINSREQLRLLTRKLESAREEEGTRIAREIHDEIGQLLTALKMDLAALKVGLSPDNQTLLGKVEGMLSLVNSTLEAVHRIATELRPLILEEEGISATLEYEARKFQERTGIACQPEISPGEVKLDQERATALYRIVQEALTNIIRHAQATKVKISLIRKEGELILEVKDNGKGIEFGKALDPNSLGIIGLKERALQFGGEVTITGSPAKGTTVTVRLPLAEAKSTS